MLIVIVNEPRSVKQNVIERQSFATGVGVDDDEIRTRNAMLRDPYGRILSETWKADNDMMVCDLDKTLLESDRSRMDLRSTARNVWPLNQTNSFGKTYAYFEV
jgi:predicted amidohydrolase